MKNELQDYLETIPLKTNIVYTDPPWTNGNCKYWRTIASRQDNNIKSYQLKYSDFLTHLKKQLPSSIPLFIEGSTHTYNELISNFKKEYKYYKCYLTYYNNRKQVLIHFNNTPIIDLDLNNTHDTEMIKQSFQYINKNIDNPVILDSCVGLGLTARTSYQYNNNFIGFDLNETRIQKTINSLKKHTTLIKKY